MAFTVQEHVLLSLHTTLKVGGPARYLITATTPDDIKAAVVFATQKQLPLFVLGGGSNILVPDAGYPGVVLKIALQGRVYDEVSDTVVHLTVGAGEELDALVADTVARHVWGLENLSHIPGTVGATPIQNVGAYGVEVADVIVSVTVFNQQTNVVESLTAAQCLFGYRDSIFKHAAGAHYIVLAVTFMLTRTPQPKLAYADLAQRFADTVPTLEVIRATIITIRSAKFPDWHTVGTAGSFFKNPIVERALIEPLLVSYPLLPVYPVDATHVKVSLGFILDKVCGLKGYRELGVRLYEAQALVLVAESGTTTEMIELFSEKIQSWVFEKTAIKIEREVTEMRV